MSQTITREIPTIINNRVSYRSGSTLKHSGFFVTVNTNKKPRTQLELDSITQALREGIADLCSDDGFKQVIYFLIAGHTFEKHIVNIKVEYAIEIGTSPRGGRIHAHLYIQVVHKSKIRLDKKKIEEILLKYLRKYGINSLYINIRVIGKDKSIKDYIRKQAKNKPLNLV
jgi:ribosomal protein S16